MIEKLSKFFIGLLVGLIVVAVIFAIVIFTVAKAQGSTIWQLFHIASIGGLENITCLILKQ